VICMELIFREIYQNKRLLLIISFFLYTFFSFGQEENSDDSGKEKVVDSLYREDQFYVGFTFNLLWNTPPGINQSGFSGGFHLGYTRDMPINKRRNVAIGLGLGYSINTYGQNLFIGENEETGQSIFSSLQDVDFDRNRFTTHLAGNQVGQTKIDELNRWRVGATFTFGWNTFNFHFYYSLNPLFNDNARIGNDEVGLSTAKIGLMFYIL